MHLSNEVFLDRLSDLFEAKKTQGSVFLTTKRLTYEPTTLEGTTRTDQDEDVDMTDSHDQPPATSSSSSSAQTKEYPLLVRATDGKGKKETKTKLSTIVKTDEYDEFIERYTTILRTHLAAGLRPKRKRTQTNKKPKSNAHVTTTTPAINPDSTTTTTKSGTGEKAGFLPRFPKVVGPRRGNGRKKRQAAVKRRVKAVEKFQRAREERAKRSNASLGL
ncbi:RNA-binding signal recognition particle subunit SRP14 [Sporobolomyces koalae]|uniref:RNA-binding signal recognition particle subunit SRP14 n=1 Tax=Sporobolomyces koalae TaxID=500713 RepID=UPI00317BE55D